MFELAFTLATACIGAVISIVILVVGYLFQKHCGKVTTILTELCDFLKYEKKWWITIIALLLLLLITFIVFIAPSTLSPLEANLF